MATKNLRVYISPNFKREDKGDGGYFSDIIFCMNSSAVIVPFLELHDLQAGTILSAV